jgi:hypothetical protein
MGTTPRTERVHIERVQRNDRENEQTQWHSTGEHTFVFFAGNSGTAPEPTAIFDSRQASRRFGRCTGLRDSSLTLPQAAVYPNRVKPPRHLVVRLNPECPKRGG